ncbi:hypothetical protein ACP4OV_030827 [Aristida adscensionis]
MESAAGDPCAICLSDVGRGQAIFTADCSHTFHLRCISDSVAHGHRCCPLCKATWRDLPAVNPAPKPKPPPPPPPPPARLSWMRSSLFNAARRPRAAVRRRRTRAAASASPAARRRGASRGSFAVLVHAKAPPAAAAAAASRAPLDLVTVLDVSGSMRGQKLALLKEAVGFVIDNLGHGDRLSVVSFSDGATRVIRLSPHDGRRNAVTSIILLSDWKDGHTNPHRPAELLPPLFAGAGYRPVPPIHTFGFGDDHAAAAMHTVAEATGGTFSFVENQDAIQDSFAQCIGGLLSVALQNVRIAVTCVHPGVRVLGVKSGHYRSHVDADRRAASVGVGELYADEERRFLLFVRVPVAEATEEDVAGDDAVVLMRPVEVPEGGAGLCMDVERERVRFAATEDIAAARGAAERGEHAEAARILDGAREDVRRSAPAAAGDPTCAALEEELRDLRARVACRREYEQTGRACVLAGMSSHAQQRASSVAVRRGPTGRLFGAGRCARGGGAARPYATPMMRSMVKISQASREQRQQQQASPPPPAPPPAPSAKRMRWDESDDSD